MECETQFPRHTVIDRCDPVIMNEQKISKFRARMFTYEITDKKKSIKIDSYNITDKRMSHIRSIAMHSMQSVFIVFLIT